MRFTCSMDRSESTGQRGEAPCPSDLRLHCLALGSSQLRFGFKSRADIGAGGAPLPTALGECIGLGSIDDDADGWRLWLRWGSDPSFAPCADSASNLLCSSCVSFESTCAWRHLCYSCCDSCGLLRMCVPIRPCLRACTSKISHAKHRDIHSNKPARLHACIRACPHLDQKERVHT